MIKKLLSVILALFVMTSCSADKSIKVRPILKIIGDVKEVTEFYDYSDLQQYDIKKDDQNIKMVKLSDVLSKVETQGSDIQILTESYDGISALLNYDEIENTYLYIDTDNHWCVYSEDLPVQSKIRYLENIVIVANKLENRQSCFRIINGFMDYTFSWGQLYMEEAVEATVLEGNAQKHDKTVGVYKKRKLIPLKNYYQSAETCIGYFADGSEQKIDPDGYILHRGNSADYIAPDKKTTINNIIGVWFDYYEKGVEYVGQYVLTHPDEKIMVIEIDGYGYTAHEKFKPEFLSSLNPEHMRTVMPSISNVALASIITGKLPNETGIKAKGERDLMIVDMFSSRKKSSVVEGDAALISMSVDQILSVDSNDSGCNDDEVFENAVEALKSNPELIYIHFHGFDDVAHSHGPYSQQAKDKITEIDKYIKSLVESFDGTVMIVSDHGQHDTGREDKKGDHGEFIYEDMVIPFFFIGENYER